MNSLKLTYYGLLLLSIVTLLIFKNKLPSCCKWLLPLFPLAFFTQALEDILRNNRQNSFFLFHIYQPIELLLLCCFYHAVFKKKNLKGITVSLIVFFFIACSIYYYFNIDAFFEPDFADFTIEAPIICALGVLFFIDMLKITEKIILKQFAVFWLNALHLIFYGGCVFVMGFYYSLHATNPKLAHEFLGINYFLNLFLYAGYSLIFICTKTPGI